jgi:D-3-phosphoglycerate dehydrogenase / 2-oxoglutarate reductase
MYKIRTFNQIAVRGLERFPRDRFELSGEFADPDAILLRSHRLIPDDITPRLRAVARAGAGVNNVPVPACTEAGVVVLNTPGANANSVKELVVAALLLSSRDVMGGLEYVRSVTEVRDAAGLDALVEREKHRFRGEEIYGKTLGVVGLGAIGSLVAQAGLGLGMRVLGYDPAISVEAAWRLPSEVARMENLHTLFARSDFVTLHVPLIDATRNLVNTDSLKSFRPETVLLNFARQEIVDEAAVADALRGGRLRRYFSDFPSPVLAGTPSFHSTPHLGASTLQAEENCAVMAADQLIDFLENGNVRNSVNFPDVYLERTPGFRLAITNENVPRVLGQVLSLLANRNINVIDMINKSRGDVAYNLIDIETPPNGGLLAEIDAIDSVINVRSFPERQNV